MNDWEKSNSHFFCFLWAVLVTGVFCVSGHDSDAPAFSVFVDQLISPRSLFYAVALALAVISKFIWCATNAKLKRESVPEYNRMDKHRYDVTWSVFRYACQAYVILKAAATGRVDAPDKIVLLTWAFALWSDKLFLRGRSRSE